VTPRWVLPTVFLAPLALFAAYEVRPGKVEGAATKMAVPDPSAVSSPASPAVVSSDRPLPGLLNRIAYIPPQCFTKTRATGNEKAHNPCYVCHTASEPPNYSNDGDLQLTLKLPKPASNNPWTNLLDPPVLHVARLSDEAILDYVRRSNYFDGEGRIALAQTLRGRGWKGFVPDVWFSFDNEGFDHAPDGQPTGWRAFGYYPFPGTFFPTNGSAADVLIRLRPSLREDEEGHFDRSIYKINLAIVQALIRRTDVAVDEVEEKSLGVDLDLDGTLSRATRVAFDPSRMRYVGRARAEQNDGKLPLAAGLFPVDTEFFHTVRYLDVGSDGAVTMAPRMKEARYMTKVNWTSWRLARTHAARAARETLVSPDGTHRVSWHGDQGVYVESGWLLQGFIEAADGSLRPQSFEETAFCEGCHGEIGATSVAVGTFRGACGDSARGRVTWGGEDSRGVLRCSPSWPLSWARAVATTLRTSRSGGLRPRSVPPLSPARYGPKRSSPTRRTSFPTRVRSSIRINPASDSTAAPTSGAPEACRRPSRSCTTGE
jgi:hypothetical protein